MTTSDRQVCTIPGYLPPPVLNGSRQKHWSTLRKEAHITKTTVWAAAKQAGWTYVPGKVHLTVTLVFGVKRRRDQDNCTARCKHVVDGLKGTFFQDDSMDLLELDVRAEVVPGMRETRLELRPASALRIKC